MLYSLALFWVKGNIPGDDPTSYAEVYDGSVTISQHFKIDFQGTVSAKGLHIDLKIDRVVAIRRYIGFFSSR
jgi:hypothetical protein